MVGCHPKLEIFSESIGNHFLLLLVASKPLKHYFLGILEFEAQWHTTALDRLWGGDETLK